MLTKNKLYSLLILACSTGYIWLFLNTSKFSKTHQSFEVCIFKRVTNIPCPSCGSTRSIIELTKSNFKEALFINPFGVFLAILMLIIPIWLIIDSINKKQSFFILYQRIENQLKKTKVIIPIAFIVLLNWIWNIMKGV